MLRALTWNILHGGGPNRTPEIALRLVEHRPGLVLLCEFRRTTGGQIAAALADHGLTHHISTDPDPGTNGLLLASRWPVRPQPAPPELHLPQRWLHAFIPDLGLHVLGVHIPDDSRLPDKIRLWRTLIHAAGPLRDTPCLVLGDFNTARHHADEPGAASKCTGLLGQFCTLGFTDAWRCLHPDAREASWRSRRAGFRIDHAYVSPPLRPALRGAFYSHAERRDRVSDHSALVLDLAVGDDPPRS